MEWRVAEITYNVAMRPASEEAVETLLCDLLEEHPDLFVVGLQEVSHAETVGGAVITWARLIADHITLRSDLVLLNKNYQATNQVAVFMKRNHLCHVQKVEFRFARNTLKGLTGHKGSIGLKITFRDNTSVVFVVSHFVHDVNSYDRRIEQFEQNKCCSFPEDPNVRAVFWLGDLNFRVEMEPEVAARKIQQGKKAAILENHEQLQRAMKNGEAFQGFTESKINFPPTYRVFVGSTEYDLKRTPSWCDRILYKGRMERKNKLIEYITVPTPITDYEGECITPVRYTSLPATLSSDHLPVYGSFKMMTSLQKAERAWDVIFERLPQWYSSVPIIGRSQYRNSFWNSRGSYMDWIGLYSDSVDDCLTPLKWIWVAACTTQVVDREKFLVCEFGPVPPSKYRIAYYSYYGSCLVGLSKSFEVIDPPTD